MFWVIKESKSQPGVFFYANYARQTRLSADIMEYCLERQIDVNDELAVRLASKELKKIEEGVRSRRTHEEMAKRMDSGVRVNAGLAKAFGVKTASSSSGNRYER